MKAGRLARPAALTLFALVAFAFYWHGYWNHPVLPGKYAQIPLGWWGWFDQGQYLTSARALRALDFTPARHHYPVGYPLIGAIFLGLLPNHAFLIPDLLFYAVICAAFVLISRRFVSLVEALLLGFFGVVWQSHVLVNLIVPWTTIPRTAALYVLIWLAITRLADRLCPLWTGLCLGLIYIVRPGDILFALPLAAVVLVAAIRQRKPVGLLLKFVGGFLPFFLLFHGFNYFVYGQPVPVAYFAANAAANGFNLRFIPIKAFSLFINPQLLFGEPDSLFAKFPYLMLALPGLMVFVKRLRGTGIAVAASQALCLAYYLAFNDFTPQNVFRYHAIHYLTWLLPLALLYAYLSFRLAWRELGAAWTVGLFALSGILFLIPEVTVRAAPVSAAMAPGVSLGRAACPPSEISDCVLGFFCPPAAFDAVFFEDLFLAGGEIVEVRLDDRVLRHRRNYRVSEPPSGTGVSVLFYGGERARSIRLVIRRGQPATVGATGAWFYRTGWTLTLRNPALLWRKLDPQYHYANFLERERPAPRSAVTLLPDGPAVVLHIAPRSPDDPLLRTPFRINVPKDFSLEAVVRPAAAQPAHATIVGDHPGISEHDGFALEQVEDKTNHFALVFGDGKGWTSAGEAVLRAGSPHYVAASKAGRAVRVWLDGTVIARQELPKDAAESGFPVRIGDWLYGGRAFRGWIEEIHLFAGVLTDQEVASRFAALRAKAGWNE